MHRAAAVLALVALACEAPPPPPAPPSRSWAYAPAPPAWPLGAVTGWIGRGQAPQPIADDGIEGPPRAPLHLPTLWAVPGEGPARAVAYGTVHGKPAVDLIDIDAGLIAWRDEIGCAGPIVGVTASSIVCADVRGVRAIGLDGKPKWHVEASFLATNDERVLVTGAAGVTVLDAGTGDELARITLPPNVYSDQLQASCGDVGRELFAFDRAGDLTRIAEAAGGPKIVWTAALEGQIEELEPCRGPIVLVKAWKTLFAIARDTGAILGRIEGARAWWPARDGSGRIEVATATGVTRWTRDLKTSETLALPPLDAHLDTRGDRVLVRASPRTAVLLDRDGVRAYLPLAASGAVLGDRYAVTASWEGSPGETLHRFAIPPPYARSLRIETHGEPLAVPAELRDLPAVVELDDREQPAGAHGNDVVAAIALAPDGATLFAATRAEDAAETAGAAVARVNVATNTWPWVRADGCGPGEPVALVASAAVIACAARGTEAATVRATSPAGAPLWTWTGGNVDALDAAGDVVLVRDADRLVVLAARDGHVVGSFASDDGAAPRAVAIELGGSALVIVAQRNRVVARVAAARLLPAWSVAVRGVVRSLARAGAGVLVALEDGDAYRLDARTGARVAFAGIGLDWSAGGDLVAGVALGGPIPPEPMPQPPPPPKLPPKPPARTPDGELAEPPIATPWPPPPPMSPSWQLSLYELTGGLRTRGDYALHPQVELAPQRGPGESPYVVLSGFDPREALVIDPKQGDPLRRVHLPNAAAPGVAFSTVVDGKPVVGTVLANPLRVVLF